MKGKAVAASMTRQEPPSAVTTACPECGEDTLHSVLHGRLGTRGEYTTLDATVQCTECNHTHPTLIRTAKDVTLPAVISDATGQSRKSTVEVPGDEDIRIGDGFIVDGLNCIVSGIEAKDMRRVEGAAPSEVGTVWFKEWEQLLIGFAINLDKKTITKQVPVAPDHEFSVGEEHLFGRLRVTVHAIKTKEGMLKRGTAEAGEIVRVFAKPTHLGRSTQRPDKATRQQIRDKEARDAYRQGRRS